MSSMAEGEMMANGPADTRIGHTTDHTSARSQATEVACGKRRRRWTAEQKRQIVAESLVPGASAAALARKHGISSGQFYAWAATASAERRVRRHDGHRAERRARG
jgi:transposase-like protein